MDDQALSRRVRPSGRRVLLVESDEALARVLGRELERTHQVVHVPTVARALAVLDPGPRFDVVVSAYRLRDGTAGKLFEIIARRWRHLRRVLLVDRDGAAPQRKVLADIVVDTGSDFRALTDALR